MTYNEGSNILIDGITYTANMIIKAGSALLAQEINDQLSQYDLIKEVMAFINGGTVKNIQNVPHYVLDTGVTVSFDATIT